MQISLKEFIVKAFDYFGLNHDNYLVIREDLFRPTDILVSKADPSKAKKILKWEAKTNVDGVIKNMIEYNLNRNSN